MKNLSFSHVRNNQPCMVDISEKPSTFRRAIAVATLAAPTSLTDRIEAGELSLKKGPVFATAIIAGIMAAKNTHALIPMCHALAINEVAIDITVSEPGRIRVECSVKSKGCTGVEMEALTGASIAALTVYDMCKSISGDLSIVETKLVMKTGGKSDLLPRAS